MPVPKGRPTLLLANPIWPRLPDPAMLMSRIIRLPAARKSCCISAFCEVTHVAFTACLNIDSAAASSTRPTPIDTIISTNVKPRVVRSLRCMVPLLSDMSRRIRYSRRFFGTLEFGLVY